MLRGWRPGQSVDARRRPDHGFDLGHRHGRQHRQRRRDLDHARHHGGCWRQPGGFGQRRLINNSEKTAVAYTVAGLDADATATVTFTDHNGAHVAGVGGLANLSTLADGLITVSISATDTAGNTASGAGTSTTLDTTADVGGNLAVSVSDSLISNSEKTAVAYTVSGLDADATATVTFTDHNGAHVAGVGGLANLSTLADGLITVSISATDTAGNTASGAGTSTTLDTTADVGGNLAVSVSDSLISNSEKTAVAYTVSGLDADATATVTFTDHNGAHVAGVGGLANLSTLADGLITVSISATDTAGNTASGAGPRPRSIPRRRRLRRLRWPATPAARAPITSPATVCWL